MLIKREAEKSIFKIYVMIKFTYKTSSSFALIFHNVMRRFSKPKNMRFSINRKRWMLEWNAVHLIKFWFSFFFSRLITSGFVPRFLDRISCVHISLALCLAHTQLFFHSFAVSNIYGIFTDIYTMPNNL